MAMALNAKPFQDTNGISRPERLERQIRGSSRISGTSSAGMVLSGYVSFSMEVRHSNS